MDFITRCLKSVAFSARLAVLFLAFFASWAAYGQSNTADILSLRVERAEADLYLSAQLRLELPPSLQDALLKGIPLHFVAETDITRERWYWSDRRVASTQRYMRVAYQPLTRRWRLNISAEPVENVGLGVSLSQYYDSMSEAMAAVLRIARWKVADAADIDSEARQSLRFRFRLDLSQLPRALQIGAVGQSDWNIHVERRLDLTAEAMR